MMRAVPKYLRDFIDTITPLTGAAADRRTSCFEAGLTCPS